MYRKNATNWLEAYFNWLETYFFVRNIHLFDEGLLNSPICTAFPDNHLHICIHKGDGLFIEKEGQQQRYTGTWLCGQLTASRKFELSRGSRTAIIKIKPWLIPGIAELPLEEYLDLNLLLEDFLSRKDRGRLAEPVGMEEKAMRLLTILNNRTLRYSPNSNVLNAIHQIESEQGRVSVETVARSVGYSRRNLERRFKELTGISIKKFINHVRFNRALRLLLTGKSLANIAYDCEYFDQAHFTACFRELVGITPGQFAKDRSLGMLYLR